MGRRSKAGNWGQSRITSDSLSDTVEISSNSKSAATASPMRNQLALGLQLPPKDLPELLLLFLLGWEGEFFPTVSGLKKV